MVNNFVKEIKRDFFLRTFKKYFLLDRKDWSRENWIHVIYIRKFEIKINLEFMYNVIA